MINAVVRFGLTHILGRGLGESSIQLLHTIVDCHVAANLTDTTHHSYRPIEPDRSVAASITCIIAALFNSSLLAEIISQIEVSLASEPSLLPLIDPSLELGFLLESVPLTLQVSQAELRSDHLYDV